MKTLSQHKINSVRRWRSKKGLCELCGRFTVGDEHECLENYVKADMREIELDKSDIISSIKNDEIEDTDKDINKKIKTIVSYRERKGLCLNCGKDVHKGYCHKNYDSSDMRSETEKTKDSKIIKTVRSKVRTIKEELKINKVNDTYLKNSNDPFIQMTYDSKIETQRKFIIVALNNSSNGQKIEFSYLNHLARRHKNLIVFVIGEISEHFSYFEVKKIEKELTNVHMIKSMMDQNIVNYLHSAIRLYGFPSKYATYCMVHNIPCTVFFKNSENFDLPCDVCIIEDSDNVDIEIIKKNNISWKL